MTSKIMNDELFRELDRACVETLNYFVQQKNLRLDCINLNHKEEQALLQLAYLSTFYNQRKIEIGLNLFKYLELRFKKGFLKGKIKRVKVSKEASQIKDYEFYKEELFEVLRVVAPSYKNIDFLYNDIFEEYYKSL